jgi:hypothetical protein
MFNSKKTPLQLSSPQGAHPSLLPLRVALTLAESETPARPRHADVNERRAMQLIARMQAKHKRISPFVNMDVPASYVFHKILQDVAVSHAG